MKLSHLARAGTALLLASVSRAQAQDFTPPVPRSELERLVLSADTYRNARVADWLKAHASDPEMIRRELGAIGFESVAPLKAGCESYSHFRVVGRNGEELSARIELCAGKEPFVLLLRGFISKAQAPGPNSPTMSIPYPAPSMPPAPPSAPPAPPAPPK